MQRTERYLPPPAAIENVDKPVADGVELEFRQQAEKTIFDRKSCPNTAAAVS